MPGVTWFVEKIDKIDKLPDGGAEAIREKLQQISAAGHAIYKVNIDSTNAWFVYYYRPNAPRWMSGVKTFDFSHAGKGTYAVVPAKPGVATIVLGYMAIGYRHTGGRWSGFSLHPDPRRVGPIIWIPESRMHVPVPISYCGSIEAPAFQSAAGDGLSLTIVGSLTVSGHVAAAYNVPNENDA